MGAWSLDTPTSATDRGFISGSANQAPELVVSEEISSSLCFSVQVVFSEVSAQACLGCQVLRFAEASGWCLAPGWRCLRGPAKVATYCSPCF